MLLSPFPSSTPLSSLLPFLFTRLLHRHFLLILHSISTNQHFPLTYLLPFSLSTIPLSTLKYSHFPLCMSPSYPLFATPLIFFILPLIYPSFTFNTFKLFSLPITYYSPHSHFFPSVTFIPLPVLPHFPFFHTSIQSSAITIISFTTDPLFHSSLFLSFHSY